MGLDDHHLLHVCLYRALQETAVANDPVVPSSPAYQPAPTAPETII